MNGRTNTRVITRTETYATLQPAVAEDYFSFYPVPHNNRRPALQRPHIPAPLHFTNKDPSPLSAGPAGWTYTPLSTRSPGFESFRYNHGVRFKQRLSAREVLLGSRWNLLLDEDALPCRIKSRCQKYLKAKWESLEQTRTTCQMLLSRFWDWLWKKLGFWSPELDGLDGLDDAAPDVYWNDIEHGLLPDIEDIQAMLSHAF